MSLTLLAPLGLLALLALAVPLLVHLVRREEAHPVPFAALRWLRPQARPRRRRVDEWLLLLLRLLLLALLALWLAQPLLHGRQRTRPWLVAAPGVSPAQVEARSRGLRDPQRHWLAIGFPRIDAAPAPASPQPLASLLRELDSVLPADTPLTVLVPRMLDGADAAPITLSRRVDWQVVDDAATVAAAPAPPQPAPSLALFDDGSLPGQARWFIASDAAWRAPGAAPPAAPLQHAAEPRVPASPHLWVWWSTAPPPAAALAWVRGGGTLLLATETPMPEAVRRDGRVHWRDDSGRPLLREVGLGRGRLLQFAQPLTADALPLLLEPAFPRALRQHLLPDPPAPTRVAARAQAPTATLPPWPQAPRPLQPWLALAIAGLFLIERVLANRPRREVGA